MYYIYCIVQEVWTCVHYMYYVASAKGMNLHTCTWSHAASRVAMQYACWSEYYYVAVIHQSAPYLLAYTVSIAFLSARTNLIVCINLFSFCPSVSIFLFLLSISQPIYHPHSFLLIYQSINQPLLLHSLFCFLFVFFLCIYQSINQSIKQAIFYPHSFIFPDLSNSSQTLSFPHFLSLSFYL